MEEELPPLSPRLALEAMAEVRPLSPLHFHYHPPPLSPVLVAAPALAPAPAPPPLAPAAADLLLFDEPGLALARLDEMTHEVEREEQRREAEVQRREEEMRRLEEDSRAKDALVRHCSAEVAAVEEKLRRAAAEADEAATRHRDMQEALKQHCQAVREGLLSFRARYSLEVDGGSDAAAAAATAEPVDIFTPEGVRQTLGVLAAETKRLLDRSGRLERFVTRRRHEPPDREGAARAFRAWRAVASSRLRAGFVARGLRRRAAAARAVSVWRAVVAGRAARREHRRRGREALGRAAARLESSAARGAVKRWHAAASRAAARDRATRARERAAMAASEIEKLRRENAKLRARAVAAPRLVAALVVRHLGDRARRAALSRLRAAAAERRLERAADLHRRRAALAKWRKRFRLARSLRARATAARRRRLRSFLGAWRARLERARLCGALADARAAGHRSRAAAAAFRAWRTRWLESERRPAALAAALRVSALSRRRAAHAALGAWRAHTAAARGRHAAAALLAAGLRGRGRVRAAAALAAWHRTARAAARREQALARALGLARLRALGSALSRWGQRAHELCRDRRLHALGRAAAAGRARRSVAAVLAAWRGARTRRVAARLLCRRARAAAERSAAASALSAWRRSAAECAGAGRAASLTSRARRRDHARLALRSWAALASAKASRRALEEGAAAAAERAGLAEALLHWRARTLAARGEDLARQHKEARRRREREAAEFAEARGELEAQVRELTEAPHEHCEQRLRELLERAQEEGALKDQFLGRTQELQRAAGDLAERYDRERRAHRALRRQYDLLSASKLGAADAEAIFRARLASV